ncbi:MAG: uracil-DNA glycosylase [Betaproteobacteria bacterium]|nr:uracil-DNA glycosylase [Betaproteobacteria bacterium]
MIFDPSALKELGLWPLWRWRGAPDAAPSAPPVETGRGGAPCEGQGAIEALGWAGLGEAVAACSACPLHAGRQQAVLGVGDRQGDWLFIGEAPGAEEDQRGEPFVGQAGKLLDHMLAALKLRRGDNVYIANVLKCRPPQNRNPLPEEIAHCAPYLMRQIALISPKVIVTLGRFAAQTVLQTTDRVGSLRGRVHRCGDIPVIVTYHPAYLLRNLPDKARAWEDLCLARQVLEAG